MSAGWTTSETTTLAGKPVTAGDEVSIPYEGRFRFLRHVVNAAGKEWVDLYGGKAHHEQLRSFRPERVRRVHRNRVIANKKERDAA